MSTIDDLKKMVISQKTAFLPAEPGSPEPETVHTALTAYDQFVSGLVILSIQGQVISAPGDEIQAARDQVNRAMRSYPRPEERDFQNYQKYKERLDRMLQLVQEIAQEKEK